MLDWIRAFCSQLSDLLFTKNISAFAALGVSGALAFFDMGHPSIRYVVYLMLLDFALGAYAALRTGHFCGAGIRKGAAKFLAYTLIIGITIIVDRGLDNAGVSLFGTFTGGFTIWLLSVEAISCLRHLSALKPGVVPEALIKWLASLQDGWDRPRRRKTDPPVILTGRAEEDPEGPEEKGEDLSDKSEGHDHV